MTRGLPTPFLCNRIPLAAATQMPLLKKHPHLKIGKACVSKRRTVLQGWNHTQPAVSWGELSHTLSREMDPSETLGGEVSMRRRRENRGSARVGRVPIWGWDPGQMGHKARPDSCLRRHTQDSAGMLTGLHLSTMASFSAYYYLNMETKMRKDKRSLFWQLDFQPQESRGLGFFPPAFVPLGLGCRERGAGTGGTGCKGQGDTQGHLFCPQDHMTGGADALFF